MMNTDLTIAQYPEFRPPRRKGGPLRKTADDRCKFLTRKWPGTAFATARGTVFLASGPDALTRALMKAGPYIDMQSPNETGVMLSSRGVKIIWLKTVGGWAACAYEPKNMPPKHRLGNSVHRFLRAIASADLL